MCASLVLSRRQLGDAGAKRGFFAPRLSAAGPGQRRDVLNSLSWSGSRYVRGGGGMGDRSIPFNVRIDRKGTSEFFVILELSGRTECNVL